MLPRSVLLRSLPFEQLHMIRRKKKESEEMPQVKVNLELCQGYGSCVNGADDVFDVGDNGLVMVLRDEIPESDRARVQEAALRCPVGALWLES